MSQVQLAKAEILISGQKIEVQFNPTTLQVELSNSINQQGEAGGTNQVSTQSSAKLGLDLLFDTSGSGEDVRNKTRLLRTAVRAPQDGSGGGGGDGAAAGAGAAYVPPRLTFQWGTFIFAGVAESYRETLDFFSADGVPLRSQVTMSLKEQGSEFTSMERPNPRGAASPAAFEVPAALGGGGAAGLAGLGGDLRAARAIASANGEPSLRFSAGASLALGGGVQLREELSFAASAGVGFGAALGAGAGTGASGATGLSIGGSPGAALGGSLGVSLGGKAGLGAGVQVSAPALRFDASRLQPRTPARQLATDAGAGFGVDGRALPSASAGLRSDVGAGRALGTRLRFDS